MKIIVDAMGGDNAPAEIVKGAVRAKKELGVDIVLVGRIEDIKAFLHNEGANENDFEIVFSIPTLPSSWAGTLLPLFYRQTMEKLTKFL